MVVYQKENLKLQAKFWVWFLAGNERTWARESEGRECQVANLHFNLILVKKLKNRNTFF